MKHPILKSFESMHMRAKQLPSFKAGDSVCVWVKIQECNEKDGTPKYRLQSVEGTVIRVRRGTTIPPF